MFMVYYKKIVSMVIGLHHNVCHGNSVTFRGYQNLTSNITVVAAIVGLDDVLRGFCVTTAL